MESLPAYVEQFIPSEAKGKTTIIRESSGGHSVNLDFAVGDNFESAMKATARKALRDYHFAVWRATFANDLPVAGVIAVVRNSSGGLGISGTLGIEPARAEPETNWEDGSIGPSIFIDFLKQKRNPSGDLRKRVNVEGPFAE